jgi:hypothetical protein
MSVVIYGMGEKSDPWLLKTPPGNSEIQVWKDMEAAPQRLVVQVGSTQLSYQWRGIEECHAMLAARRDWVALGNADEEKPCQEGSIEAWARDPANPVGGYYGLRKGYRGRFSNHVTPVMEMLGMIELEHNPRNNRARAL